jgi:subtilisin family serine protease
MRKSLLLLTILLLILTCGFTQTTGKFRVSFTDKNNSPYSLSNPQAFLSQRALARRAAQGIALDLRDLPVSPSYVQGVAATGAVVINRSKWFNSVVADIQTTTQYNAILALSYVDTLVFLAPAGTKSQGADKFLAEMQPIAASSGPRAKAAGVINYGLAENQALMINIDQLHDLGYTGDGMIIAVIDAGFTGVNSATVFDSLWSNGRILGTKDFAEPNGDIFTAHSHGTMVLSIMGGNLPGVMVGTAPKASYYLLRSEIGASEYLVEEDNWVAAAEFADSAGADVINSSLGYTEFYEPSQSHTYEDMDGNSTRVTQGADLAASRGILVVNSAGNSGASSWKYIGAPADGDSVFAIGAVDAWGLYAGFSSQGPAYDGRVKPDVSAQGQGTAYGDPWGNINTGNGTSFSSPVMAGAAACLWQAHPGLTNVQLMDAIRRSASQYSNPDSLLGYGIPDFAAASLILGKQDIQPVLNTQSIQVIQLGSDEMLLKIEGLKADPVVNVIDIQGRAIAAPRILQNLNGSAEWRIPLDNWAKGVYLIRVTDGSTVTASRFLRP